MSLKLKMTFHMTLAKFQNLTRNVLEKSDFGNTPLATDYNLVV